MTRKVLGPHAETPANLSAPRCGVALSPSSWSYLFGGYQSFWRAPRLSCRSFLRAVPIGALVALLSACSADSTVVVARLHRAASATNSADAGRADAGRNDAGSGDAGRNDAGSADAGSDDAGKTDAGSADAGRPPLAGAGAGFWGPADAWWSLFKENGGQAEWGEPAPSSASVTVIADSPVQVKAGLKFQFESVRDLSGLGQLELNVVDIAEGDSFELFLGSNLDAAHLTGCFYTFAKKSSEEPYRVDLSSPSWCVPTQCGFNLQVRGGLVLANVPEPSRLTATLTDLKFTSNTSGVGAGRASALGGAYGPGPASESNGLCWFLVNWQRKAIVNWRNTPPNSGAAHVGASVPAGSNAGMAFEIPDRFNLSQYRTMVIDATVSVNTTHENPTFLVQGVYLERGLVWELPAQGSAQTYRIDLTQSKYSFSGGGIGLDEATRIEIVAKQTDVDTSIDARVTGVRFEK